MAPAHGTLSGTAPALTYTPEADFNGSDSFTFKANDGQADSDATTVMLQVLAVTQPGPTPTLNPTPTPNSTPVPGATPSPEPVNHAPVAVPDSYATRGALQVPTLG